MESKPSIYNRSPSFENRDEPATSNRHPYGKNRTPKRPVLMNDQVIPDLK